MKNRTAILLAFVLLKFLLQYFLIIPDYDLHRDEYLHLDQANHPAWGYLSVPPVTSWVASIIGWLGNPVWAVRFFPVLFGALTMVVVWKSVEALKGSLYACILAATCMLFSVLLRLNQLFQPNSLDVLCWTMLYYLLIRYIGSRDRRWLYCFGAVFAIGFLNKYNIAFLIIGLLPAVLITPQRKLLTDRHVYLAFLLALLLISPNLIWQYQHGFPVFHHMKLLAETQLVNVNRADFLMEQVLFFIGSLFVIAAGLYAFWSYKPFLEYRLFLFAFIFTLAVFTFLRAKSYYAIGVYPIYIAFGAVYLNEKMRSPWMRVLFVMIPVLVFTRMLGFLFPNKTPDEIVRHPERYQRLGLLRWEDGKDHQLPQDFADMLGWKELAAKVDAAYASVPDREATIVLCDNYGQAGAINYYTRQGVRAVTFNADYVDWFDLTKNYKHLIRVKNRWERQEEMAGTGPLFRAAYAADSVTNKFAREYGTVVFVFRDAKVDITGRLVKEINEERW